MESIEAESFRKLLFEDNKNTPEKTIEKTTILYIKVDDRDDVISALAQSNKLSKNIMLLLGSSHFLTLESIQNGQIPELEQNKALYLLCNHGYLSELAGLYLEVAGFEKVSNVTGGLESLLKLET